MKVVIDLSDRTTHVQVESDSGTAYWETCTAKECHCHGIWGCGGDGYDELTRCQIDEVNMAANVLRRALNIGSVDRCC